MAGHKDDNKETEVGLLRQILEKVTPEGTDKFDPIDDAMIGQFSGFAGSKHSVGMRWIKLIGSIVVGNLLNFVNSGSFFDNMADSIRTEQKESRRHSWMVKRLERIIEAQEEMGITFVVLDSKGRKTGEIRPLQKRDLFYSKSLAAEGMDAKTIRERVDGQLRLYERQIGIWSGNRFTWHVKSKLFRHGKYWRKKKENKPNDRRPVSGGGDQGPTGGAGGSGTSSTESSGSGNTNLGTSYSSLSDLDTQELSRLLTQTSVSAEQPKTPDRGAPTTPTPSDRTAMAPFKFKGIHFSFN